jgi:hypothetical protein
VECNPNGQNAARAPVCVEQNIGRYPTWQIGGTRLEEIVPPARLAALSGYSPPPAQPAR